MRKSNYYSLSPLKATRNKQDMYRYFLLLLVVLFIGSGLNLTAQNNTGAYRPGEMFIKICPDLRIYLPQYHRGSNAQDYPVLGNLIQPFGITAVSRPFTRLSAPEFSHIYHITFTETDKAHLLWRELTNLPQVEYAEGVPIDQILDTPNDPLLNNGEQEYLSAINALEALGLGTGSANVTLAIVDDAVSLNHEDLAPCIYTNPNEIPGNGIDDDGNGLIDDRQGWDFADADNNANPPANASAASFSHGTHCAGTAGSATNNGIGIASLGSGVKILPVKCTANFSNNTALITHGWQGVEYAIAQGAHIISISWGSTQYSSVYNSLVSYAHNQGIVIVAAAGNANTDTPFYPAAYESVLSVAACDNSGKKASFSNYGTWIDLVAPGVNIKSAIASINNAYGIKSGTSMATPLVAGLCALLRSHNNNLNPDEIKNCLTNTATDISLQNPDYTGKLGTGMVNAYNAVLCALPDMGCNAPNGLHATNVGATGATLNWQSINNAALYTLRYKPTNSANWITKNTPTNNLPVADLTACSTYEFQVRVTCPGGQPSVFSGSYYLNTISAETLTYCQTNALNSSAEWIGQIALNNLLYTATTLPATNTGYENNTCTEANLQTGNNYTLVLTPAFALMPYNEYWRVWIDYNRNGSFSDTGELVFDSGSLSASAVSGTITIPANAAIGKTTMRVAMKWVGSEDYSLPNPCTAFAMGQVKDFGVNITAPPVNNCPSPLNPSTADITFQSAVINCTVPPTSGSCILEYREINQTNWQSIIGIGAFPYTVNGLLSATGYQYRIKQQCSGGLTSDYSPTGYFTTAQPPCNAPETSTASGITNVAATITWSSVSGAATFEIRYRQQGSAAPWLLTTAAGYTATLAGLVPGTSYEYQIRSICSQVNVGNFSAVFVFTTAGSCLTPTGLTATNISPNTALAQWNAQAGVASYQVRYRKQGAPEWQNQITITNSLQLTGLEEGATYEVRVRTVCNAGSSSAFSAIYTFVTNAALNCDAPTGLNVLNATANAAQLNWQPAAGALSYEVQYRLWGNPSWNTQNTGTATSTTLTTLNAGATYVSRVKALCSSGSSAFTPEVVFTTTDVLALCGAPQNLIVTGNSPTQVSLLWSAEANAQNYQLQYGIAGSNTWITLMVTGNSFMLDGLIGCTQYVFRVKSTCGGTSSSGYSPQVLHTTACTTPITGTGIALNYCTSQGTNASLEWIAGVQISDLNNASGSNAGYGNFTHLSAELTAGNTYPITLTPGFAAGTYNEYWRVWIDLNRDGDFADAGELVFDAGMTSSAPVAGSITIPDSATLGETRMRVTVRFKNAAPACGAFSYGETEDYTVNISAAALIQEVLPDIATTLPDCSQIPMSIAFDYEVDEQTATFTNLSTGNFDEVLWSFGDGNSSNQLHATHQYAASGEYFFQLTIINSATNCMQQYEGYLYITQPQEGIEEHFIHHNAADE